MHHGGFDPNRLNDIANKAESMHREANLHDNPKYRTSGRRSIAYKLVFPIAFLIVFGILIALTIIY